MANWENLIANIESVIKQNARQEITGDIMQIALKNIITQVGADYRFAGVANINTTPKNSDGGIFYLTDGNGIYKNFSNIEVRGNEVAILQNTATGWQKISTNIASNMMEILIASTYMSDVNRLIETEFTGEALNGGIVDIQNQYFKIPVGVSGTSTYVQRMFNQKYGAETLNKGSRIRVLYKVKYNTETEPNGINYGFAINSTGVTDIQISKYKIGDYFYILREIKAATAANNGYMRAYVQMDNSSIKETEIECTLVDLVIYSTDEGVQREIQKESELTRENKDSRMTAQILKRALDKKASYRPDEVRGEALNGGVISIAEKKITIPKDKTGKATYIQGVWNKTNELLEKLEAGDVWGVMSVRFTDLADKNMIFGTQGIRAGDGANINTGLSRVEHPTDNSIVYFYSKIDKEKAYINSYDVIAYSMQIDTETTATKGYERVIEILDFVLFANEQSELNIEFEKRELDKYLLSSTDNIDSQKAKYKTVENYKNVSYNVDKGEIILSGTVYNWTVEAGLSFYGTFFKLQIDKLRGLEVGDVLVYNAEIKEYKNSEYNIYKLLSAAYFRINKTSPILVYFYDDRGATISYTLEKVKEDTICNYYKWSASINITQTYLNAILDSTFTSIEITMMDATSRTSSENYILEIEPIIGRIGNNKEVIFDNVREQKEIRESIEEIKKVIGTPYNTNYKDALVRWNTELTTGIRRNKGYTINTGVSEENNILEVVLDWGRFFGKTESQGTYDIFLNYNGSSDEVFEIDVLDNKRNKIGVATYWHDYNNNYIRVNYPISGFKDMDNIILRVKAKSNLKKGYSIYYDHTVILGYGELEPIKDRLLNLESEGKPNIVIAPNGNKFQIVADNDGNLSTQSFYFSKMLVITHSFGYHGRSESLGWYSVGDWGMAASAREKDYPHELLKMMKTVNPDAEIEHIVNVATFERNHNNADFNFSDYDYLNNYDFDVIVIKIGENAGSNYQNMADHIIELIDNHVGVNKNFKLFIMSMFEYSTDTWNSTANPMNNEFRKVAEHYKSRLVMINKWGGVYGDTYTAKNPANLLPPKPDGTQPNKETEVNSGVLWHPGDTGQYMMAEETFIEMKRGYNID